MQAKDSEKLWKTYYQALQKQDWKKALPPLEALRENTPGNPQIHLKIGDLLQRTGDTASAVSAYRDAAKCLEDSGFAHKAVAIYKIILRLAPNDREAGEKSLRLLKEMEAPKPSFLPERLEADPEQHAHAEEERADLIASDTSDMAEQLPETPSAPEQVREEPSEETTEAREPHPSLLPEAFSFLTDEEKMEFTGKAEHRSYGDGDIIISEGDTGDSMYIIKDGKAKVVSSILGKAMTLAVLSRGDFFGEVAFLTGRPRTASVIADGGAEVLEINSNLLKDTIEKNPLVLDSLVDFYHSRVQDTIRKLKDRT